MLSIIFELEYTTTVHLAAFCRLSFTYNDTDMAPPTSGSPLMAAESWAADGAVFPREV